MSVGLVALLDDIAALAKVAAASIDDIAGQAAKAGTKAAGVVIDDTAVTPRYVTEFSPARELPIIGKIALGSLKNKLLMLLPAALALSLLLPQAITPLLMIGGAYLCYEGAEKVYEFLFPHEAHAQLYGQLALNLRGIVSQRLVPLASGSGRAAAIEIMLNTPRIADLVAKGEIGELKTAIEQNVLDGSQSFDQALYLLYRVGKITLDEALTQADSANNLRLKIKMEDAGTAAVIAQEAEGAAIPGPNTPPPAFTLKQKEAGWAA